MLMARVARKVKDKRVLRLTRRYLQAGVMVDGVVLGVEEGTPQGGPLSPLLANILLDDLDKELEKRHHFVRYADDCNVYVRTHKAGHRVMGSVTAFLEQRLKLRINREKSAVDRPARRKFLGFRLFKYRGKVRIGLASKTLERVKARLRELTARNPTRNMQARIKELNTYLRGWVGYYCLAETPTVFDDLDEWVRHRLQACLWKQWKRVKTRIRELRNLGLADWAVLPLANARKGYWRVSGGPLNRALGAAYWQAQGLISLLSTYRQLRQPC